MLSLALDGIVASGSTFLLMLCLANRALDWLASEPMVMGD